LRDEYATLSLQAGSDRTEQTVLLIF
jgi:hypothetical protein